MAKSKKTKYDHPKAKVKPKTTPTTKSERATIPTPPPPSANTRSKTQAKAADQATNVESDALETAGPKYKEDINAFSDPPSDGEDYISKVPSEMLDRILSYCVMDHEPEMAARKKAEGDGFVKLPHVLLSLAAMSKHFKDHVESFCRLEMTRDKRDWYHFHFRKSRHDDEAAPPRRRSPRLKDQPVPDYRCYRMEMVGRLQWNCLNCGYGTDRDAVMANALKCHKACETEIFPHTINMTDALRKYDLRDWMLLKTRQPGPRAKKIDLPTIQYATVFIGTPLWLGRVVSYRFFENDIQRIAELVHNDLDGHLAKKNKKQTERMLKKRRMVHRELKIRYHADEIEFLDEIEFPRDEDWVAELEYHQERLSYYTGADWDPDGDSDDESEESKGGYGSYNDVHSKLCTNLEDCDICWEHKMQKYHDWW